MLHRIVVAASLSAAVASAQTGWTQRAPALAPATRGWNLLDYDLLRGTTVLYGGWDTGAVGDTWEWSGNAWVSRAPAHSPPARCCGAHAYDLARGRIVLFGGWSGGNDLDETWEYDGVDWTQMTPATLPQPRRLTGMAYDIVLGRLVMFGGANNGTMLDDTWTWDGVNWQQLQPAHHPSARWSFGMAADPAHTRLLLHGGSNQFGGQPATFRDTWAWNGLDWVQVSTQSQPPAVLSFAFGCDWANGEAVLFGGEPVSNQTWVLRDDVWAQDVRPAPSARYGVTMAYDIQGARMAMFAGYGGTVPNDTWDYVIPEVALWRTLGAGCAGTAGVPLLRPSGTQRPVLGSTMTLQLQAMPANAAGALGLGFSTTSWSGGALPASLAPLGMPGCTLFVDPTVLFFVQASALGQATRAIALPNVPAFAGVTFHAQAFVLDPAANVFGAVLSNAGTAIVGTL